MLCSGDIFFAIHRTNIRDCYGWSKTLGMAHHSDRTGFELDRKYIIRNTYPIHLLSLWILKNLPDTAQGAVNRRDVCINKTVFLEEKNIDIKSLFILSKEWVFEKSILVQNT